MRRTAGFVTLVVVLIATAITPAGGTISWPTLDQKLRASDGEGGPDEAGDWYGQSVAIDGNFAVVGAEHDDDEGTDAGAAYVYRRDNGGTWREEDKLVPSDGAAGDLFSRFSVAISDEIAIVGSPFDDDDGTDSGSAYVFERRGSSWVQVQKLKASDAGAGDSFGISVAMDGTTAIIGAFEADGRGAAYIFERESGSWTQQRRLSAGDGANDDFYGWSVEVKGDTAIVGAYGDDDKGTDSGSAYLYTRSGSSWSLASKVTARDGTSGDWFGWDVETDDGRAVIGARRANSVNSGGAYIFVRQPGGTWSQTAELGASDGAMGDDFGEAVAIEGDVVIVGAFREDDRGRDAGSVYIFERVGEGVWVERFKIAPSDGEAENWFGQSVALDGSRFIVGSLRGEGVEDDTGAAYVYEFPDDGSGGGPEETSFQPQGLRFEQRSGLWFVTWDEIDWGGANERDRRYRVTYFTEVADDVFDQGTTVGPSQRNVDGFFLESALDSPRTVQLGSLGPGNYTVRVTADNGVALASSERVPLSIASQGAYVMIESDGQLYGFGDPIEPWAPRSGATGVGGGAVYVDVTGDGRGAWVLKEDGTVSVVGSAQHHGNLDPGVLEPGETPSALSATPNGDGYWIFTSRGRAVARGAAQFFGDVSQLPLNGPVVASTATPSGLGYYMIGSDGGVFAFGDAEFHGSMGGIPLNQPVNGIAPDPDGEGYWLVASDGGIFSFKADFRGSMGSVPLNGPVVGAVAFGDGYLLVGSDGGLFNFSSLDFIGSLGSNPPDTPVRGVAAVTPTG
ncbi:MAG: FG-GAP repeat protein [Actinomycetota bacterium]